MDELPSGTHGFGDRGFADALVQFTEIIRLQADYERKTPRRCGVLRASLRGHGGHRTLHWRSPQRTQRRNREGYGLQGCGGIETDVLEKPVRRGPRRI